MTTLSLKSVRYCYPGKGFCLGPIAVEARSGEIIAVLGPNGAGKSTLLDLLAAQRAPEHGSYEIDGRDMRELSGRDFAQLVAHVPQTIPTTENFAVADVVLTGRLPHSSGIFESPEDHAALADALRKTHLEGFAARGFATLSGGEKQRVLLAAALCQDTPVLLLDEPSAHLDPEHQILLWQILKELREEGKLILIITHQLSLPLEHADRLWFLSGGKLAADTTPRQALEQGTLEQTFKVPFHWHYSNEGRLLLQYGN